ncbi:hypothetical protein EBT31_03110 [bacterium]|nr:hypothetical protein [bacterium]
MRKFSLPAVGVGIGMLLFALVQGATGHPPHTFAEAIFLSSLLVMISAMGGFEWGLICLLLHALVAWWIRDAVVSAAIMSVVAVLWYGAVTVLAAHGSRVLMGIAAGVLFAGLMLERMPLFSWREWVIFIACVIVEVSGMYLAGNVLKGRWFSPYA